MLKLKDELKTSVKKKRIMTDSHYRTILFAGFSTTINLIHALWNLFTGFNNNSYWFITTGAYYTVDFRSKNKTCLVFTPKVRSAPFLYLKKEL